jgi:hypothetical protein
MGSEIQTENYDIRGPIATTLFNIAVTGTSAPIDLSGSNYVNLLGALQAGRMVTLAADGGNIWYRWASATGTVDQTKTAADTPANQGSVIFDGERIHERPPLGATGWLIVKGSTTCTLRIYVSSVSPSAFLGI